MEVHLHVSIWRFKPKINKIGDNIIHALKFKRCRVLVYENEIDSFNKFFLFFHGLRKISKNLFNLTEETEQKQFSKTFGTEL